MRKIILVIVSVILSVVFAGMVLAKKTSDFCQADYDKVIKGEKSLIGAQLERANFKEMNLQGINFSRADLEKANFEGANLTGSIFNGADLEEASFAGANLTNVSFIEADLEGAVLKGAKITGANFKKAELEYATWIDGKVCAEGSIGGCW